MSPIWMFGSDSQPVQQAVYDRGLFTAGWFGVKEKYNSSL